eukprot:scaffold54766_cov20-Prasinocladus_malaysianus.AAC.1
MDTKPTIDYHNAARRQKLNVNEATHDVRIPCPVKPIWSVGSINSVNSGYNNHGFDTMYTYSRSRLGER